MEAQVQAGNHLQLRYLTICRALMATLSGALRQTPFDPMDSQGAACQHMDPGVLRGSITLELLVFTVTGMCS